MLSIKAELDSFEMVEDYIGIITECACENAHFKDGSHLFDKLKDKGSKEKFSS